MKEDKLKISKRRLKGDDGFKVFSVRLEQELVDRIDNIAEYTNRSRNELIGISENTYKKLTGKSADLKNEEIIYIVNEYKKNDINIYHFDVYRLEDSSEFYAIGGEEYFENGICLIEWGELIQDALPNEYIKINFTRNELNENERILNIQSLGKKYDDIIDTLKGE